MVVEPRELEEGKFDENDATSSSLKQPWSLSSVSVEITDVYL